MPAQRTFTVSGSRLTLANQAVTLVFLNPPASGVGVEVLRCQIAQNANATSAQVAVQLNTQVTAFPTLVSATPAAHNRADTVASVLTGNTTGAAGTAGVNASAEGAGAKTVIIADSFNALNGWIWVPTDWEQIYLPAGLASGFGLHLPVAPATLTGWTFLVTYRER